MRCQHCSLGESRHQPRTVAGVTVPGRCRTQTTSWTPAILDREIPPGGYVCAMPAATTDGICGRPVESTPCDVHGGVA